MAAIFGGLTLSFFWPMIICLFITKVIAFAGLVDSINNNLISEITRIVLNCSFLSTAVYIVLRKGAFLYDDRLVIARYTFSLTNWKPRIVINYNDIEKVNVNYFDIHFTKRRFSMLVLCGDESYNVELTLKNGKTYYFSIEDQEEFCENLNRLMEKYNNK